MKRTKSSETSSTSAIPLHDPSQPEVTLQAEQSEQAGEPTQQMSLALPMSTDTQASNPLADLTAGLITTSTNGSLQDVNRTSTAPLTSSREKKILYYLLGIQKALRLLVLLLCLSRSLNDALYAAMSGEPWLQQALRK